MNIHINPSMWGSVFAVPSSVVDDHIRMAGSAQLKVLLWLLRHLSESPCEEDAAKALRMARADVSDAMQYWLACGVFLADGEAPAPVPSAERPQEPPLPTPQKLEPAPPPESATKKATRTALLEGASKPTREEVASRGMESPEIAFLLNEAQLRLGRLLSQNDASTLVWLHDYAGMPVEVILMVIEFAVLEDKRSTRYIERVALDWIDNDIDTIAKAEKRIGDIQKSKSAWNRVVRLLGLENRKPTAAEQNAVDNWVNRWKLSDDLILAAYEETVDHTGKYKYSYMNKILQKWFETDVKTRKDLEKAESRRPAGKAASFDVEEYERLALQGPLGAPEGAEEKRKN